MLWPRLNLKKLTFLSGSNQLYKIILNPIPFWDLTQKSKQADTGTYYAAFKLYIQTHELMILGYRRIFLAQHSEFADDAIIYMNFPLSFSSSRVFFFKITYTCTAMHHTAETRGRFLSYDFLFLKNDILNVG